MQIIGFGETFLLAGMVQRMEMLVQTHSGAEERIPISAETLKALVSLSTGGHAPAVVDRVDPVDSPTEYVEQEPLEEDDLSLGSVDAPDDMGLEVATPDAVSPTIRRGRATARPTFVADVPDEDGQQL